MEYALEAAKNQTVVMGVKGVSLTSLIPNFNIIACYPPEYMHSVLLGVVRLLLNTWFDSQSNNEPYYLRNKKQIFDARMLEILPRSEITRTP